MRKITLLLKAAKIEYKWLLIKIIRKRREKLNTVIFNDLNRERKLKHEASAEGKNYETLSGFRE